MPFCGIGYNFYTFIFLFLFIWSLFFIGLARNLQTLFNFSRNHLLVSLIFFYCPFLLCISIISTLICIITFHLLTLVFGVFQLHPWNGRMSLRIYFLPGIRSLDEDPAISCLSESAFKMSKCISLAVFLYR